MTKNILVVGFGGMGCRHVQSLKNASEPYDISIIEVSQQIIDTNLPRIDAVKEDFSWYSSVEEADKQFDLAILATSSAPRHQLVKNLLEKGVKNFLLEKIVFQSAAQFEEIISLLEKHKAKTYCNFVNRYFNAYNTIKDELNGSPVSMTVYGGPFGLGCNAIHYIDIFQYITGNNDIRIGSSELEPVEGENRRGSQYKEFTGMLAVQNGKGDRLTVITDKDDTGGNITINITHNNGSYTLSEITRKLFIRKENADAEIRDFTILPTSRLTSIIANDIFNGQCRLTGVKDTYPAHRGLFAQFNTFISGSTSDEMICPIT